MTSTVRPWFCGIALLVTASAVTWLTSVPRSIAQQLELPASHGVQPELYATGFEFAEGPAFDRQGNLFVVNYRGNGNIGRIANDGTASVWCILDVLLPVEGQRAQANGLKVDSEGRLVVADAGGGRLLRISGDGKSGEVLADRCNGQRFNSINDVALDTKGNIYFSDPGGSNAEHPIGSVYRFDISTNTTTRLATNLAFPNGLAVTADQQHLCVGESARYRVMLYDLSNGQAVNERVLIDFPRQDEGNIRGGLYDPDGMIVDEAGRLYVAMWVGGVINVVDVPTGKLLRQYDAGGLKATNCHFHDGYLYTTIAAKEAVFRLRLGVNRFDYN